MLTSGAIAPSGDTYALGGSGGYVHLWCNPGTLQTPQQHAAAKGSHGQSQPAPRIHLSMHTAAADGSSTASDTSVPPIPPPLTAPSLMLAEETGFGCMLPLMPTDPRFILRDTGMPLYGSDWVGRGGRAHVMSIGKPPRVLDASLLKDAKKVRYMRYICMENGGSELCMEAWRIGYCEVSEPF